MRLGEIMSEAVMTAAPADPAEDAYEVMRAHGIHHLVVKDGAAVVGVLSDRDLGGARGGAVRRNRSVAELMTTDVVTAPARTTVKQAANLLRGRSIGCLPILEKRRLVGIVTTTDLLELVAGGMRRASTDARWKPVRRMGRWPRVSRRATAP